MSKDRAAPFSRKHRRYWIPVTGGMILIGLINLVIGFLSYDEPPQKTEKIEFILDAPPPSDAGVDAPHDAPSAEATPGSAAAGGR